MKIERRTFESYEDARNALTQYNLYVGFGNKGIGINFSLGFVNPMKLEGLCLNIDIGILKSNKK